MHPQDEYAWDAFCYLAGEMTADESARFEAVLAEDQRAREALAEAVELAQAASAALAPAPSAAWPSRAAKSGDRRRRGAAGRWMWLAAGAAACLVMIFGWQQLRGLYAPGAAGNSLDARATADARALAARWSEVRQRHLPLDVWDALAAPDDWLEGELGDDDEASDGALGDAGRASPPWMLAAARLNLQDGATMDHRMIDDIDRGLVPPQEQ